MFDFTYTILEHEDIRGYLVQYVPQDPDCTSITQWVGVANITDEKEILSVIKNTAPTHMWLSQKNQHTYQYSSLVGRSESIEANVDAQGNRVIMQTTKVMDNGETHDISIVVPREV